MPLSLSLSPAAQSVSVFPVLSASLVVCLSGKERKEGYALFPGLGRRHDSIIFGQVGLPVLLDLGSYDRAVGLVQLFPCYTWRQLFPCSQVDSDGIAGRKRKRKGEKRTLD